MYIGGHVLEIGAGLGETTKALMSGKEDSWTCLEPDSLLAKRFAHSLSNSVFPNNLVPKIIVGTIDHLKCNRSFDTILYIDVLEHIDDDRLEMEKASDKLSLGGNLIVLAPAHQWLYSAFDSSIGHFRRYNFKSLKIISPPGTRLLRLRYLDSFGCLASLGNRLIIKSGIPSSKQLKIWDGLMIPLSRLLDPIFKYKIGKSVYGVWQKLDFG
jgi:hypothetical protein